MTCLSGTPQQKSEMGKYAIVVLGPAGSGKSTACRVLQDHYATTGRSTHVVNLDPAAEDPLQYGKPSVDVRELISLDDVIETKGLGPNGGLIYCMEYLAQNTGWLRDELEDYADDFLIVDMPGQIELLSHVPVVPQFVDLLRQEGYMVSSLFLVDSGSVTSDPGKFVSASLLCLNTMMSIDCPFVNCLSKADLLPQHMKPGSRRLEHFELLEFDHLLFADRATDGPAAVGAPPPLPKKWEAMTRQLATIVNDFSLVRFRPLNIQDEDSIGTVATLLNDTLQVADDDEIKDVDFGDGDGEEHVHATAPPGLPE